MILARALGRTQDRNVLSVEGPVGSFNSITDFRFCDCEVIYRWNCLNRKYSYLVRVRYNKKEIVDCNKIARMEYCYSLDNSGFNAYYLPITGGCSKENNVFLPSRFSTKMANSTWSI